MKNPALQRKNLYNKHEVEYSHKMAIYQGMAMVFVTLEWHYGWKEKRLQRLFNNVQSIAEIPPIFGKAPDALEQMQHFKQDYQIDFMKIQLKEDLKQCNAKWKELHQIETLVQTLRADARSTKAVCYNHEPKSKGEATAAVQTYVERLEELSNRYEQVKENLMKDVQRVEQGIAELPPDLRVLMRYRYIMGFSWEKIAETMHISVGTFHNWHRKALNLLKLN